MSPTMIVLRLRRTECARRACKSKMSACLDNLSLGQLESERFGFEHLHKLLRVQTS